MIKIKKSLVAVLIIATIVPYSSYSQYAINSKIRASSILIQTSSGSGSGFLLQDTVLNYIYAVTASHVLLPNNKSAALLPDTITIIGYRDDVDSDQKNIYKVSIKDCYNTGNLLLDIKNDIAIIRFGKVVDKENYSSIQYPQFVKKISKETKIETWPSFLSIPIEKVTPGSDLFVIGFPQSLGLQGNFDMNRPLMRKGIIAGKDLQLGRIIGDGAVYFGNSGGIAVAVHFENKVFKLMLVGLVSQYIPFDESLFDRRGVQRSLDFRNSGYSVIIPVNYILQLIQNFK